MFIGSHISVAGGYVKMGQDALSIGANTLAFFTRNPRGGKKKAVNIEDVGAFRILAEKNGFGKLVAHAPYTLNPCAQAKKVREFARIAVSEDLEAMESLPGNYYNFHPGSHTGQGVEVDINLICELLNHIITPDQQTVVLLETMAGKGSEVGGNFEELAAIIDGIEEKVKIGICMDSCHISDAGYDIVNDLDGVLGEFDRVIGLSYLKALHLNDSQNPRGSRKDRHAKIGEGYLGLDTFRRIVNHPDLRDLPMILETPNGLAGYASEISLLRSMVK